MNIEQEEIAAQVLDAKQKFGTSRISDQADASIALPLICEMPQFDKEIGRELFIAGARAMLSSILTAHKMAAHYPAHQEVFVALMHTLKAELDDHVVELFEDILSLVKRMEK